MEEMVPNKPYECRMLDLISDCQWNPRYNMFALSGFGQHFPVLIYVFQRTKDELDRVLLSGAGIQMGTQRAIEWEEAHRRELEGKFDEESLAASRHGGAGGSRRQSVLNRSRRSSEFNRSGRHSRANRSFH